MKSRYFITPIIVLALLFLSACTRSASTALPVTMETEEGFLTFTEVPSEVVKNAAPTQEPTKAPTKAPVKEKTATPAPTETPVVVISMPTTEIVNLTPSAPLATAPTPLFQVFEGEGYGYPTFGIRGVVFNDNVTIQGYEFPAADSYTVTMSPANSYGVGAIEVGSFETGEGGSYLLTLDIPEGLYNVGTIAIRIEFSDGQYAVNWFYNITTK